MDMGLHAGTVFKAASRLMMPTVLVVEDTALLRKMCDNTPASEITSCTLPNVVMMPWLSFVSIRLILFCWILVYLM